MLDKISLPVAILFICIGVVLTVISQLLLKLSARESAGGIRQFLNWKVFVAYCFFFMTTVFNVLALKIVPLSYAPIWNAASFILLNGICYFFLHEDMSKKKLTGLLFILGGIIVFMMP